MQDEIVAVFRKVRGRTREERKAAKLALLHVALLECGFHQQVIDALIYRAQSVAGIASGVKKLSDRELIGALREKVSTAISFVDPVVLAQAGGRDLAIALGILIEKLQLLEGKPTSITREERVHITKLIPELVREAQSRGYDVEKIARASPALSAHVTDAVYEELDRR